MKPILLLENRTPRREILSEASLNGKLENSPILYLPKEKALDSIINDTKNGDFGQINTYRAIFIHKSIFTLAELDKIYDHVEASLVLFSGGITRTTKTINKGRTVLFIDSGTFYGGNLEYFLERVEETPTVIELDLIQFGPMWELNILKSLRRRITQWQLSDRESAEEFLENIHQFMKTNSSLSTIWQSTPLPVIEVVPQEKSQIIEIAKTWVSKLIDEKIDHP